MEFVFSSDCLLHDTGGHPERIERLNAFRNLPDNRDHQGEKFLELVHTRSHIDQVKKYCSRSIPLNPDTLTSPDSYSAACAAVGASIAAADTNGFALIRPPGHHAYPDRSTGFCLFNNIAIAVRYLTGLGKKIFILDIDGHLGDGTCAVFYEDPNVLFCSLHQYPAFPGTGWIDEVGTGAGQGFTINIPMPPGSGDDVFWKGLDFILPIAKSFDPDIVAVSAGFDAHRLDPLLQLQLSLNCYYRCGSWLNDQFKEVFAVLEGGYNLNVLPKAIEQFYNGVNGRPQRHFENETTSDHRVESEFDQNLNNLHQIAKDFWPI